MSDKPPLPLTLAQIIDTFNAGLGKACAWLTLFLVLGTAVVLQCNGHVRVDTFYQKFSGRRQALVDGLGTLLFLLPVCLFLGWASWDYVGNSWATLEGSSESGGLKFVYLQKSIILVLVFSLVLQGIANLIKSAYILTGRLPAVEVTHG